MPDDPTWDDEDFITAISETGCAFANDYDDDKDGWFGFHVSAAEEPDGRAVLSATWQPADEEGGAGPKEERSYYLVPFDPEAKAEPEGKHEHT